MMRPADDDMSIAAVAHGAAMGASAMNWSSYASPMSWRYGSPKMRSIWSEQNKRRLWRKIWIVLARQFEKAGVVTRAQLLDLERNALNIDVPRALEIEAIVKHDLVAELRCFAEQSLVGGAILHLGATSLDIEDNAEVIRMSQSLDLVLSRLRRCLTQLVELVEEWADVPTLGFTHLQPATPTTVGHRLAVYLDDLFGDLKCLQQVRDNLVAKGFRGAVGSSASFLELASGADEKRALINALEIDAMEELSLTAAVVTNQTYPRKQDYTVFSALSGIAQSLYRMSFDLRLLQMPAIGEVREKSAKMQVSSSVMPFKRNPVDCETINSLARLVINLTTVTWENGAHALLERTLDDAANRNEILPLGFLAVDEMLIRACRVLEGLEINTDRIAENLSGHQMLASTERILMACVAAGGDRQAIHERLRVHCHGALEQGDTLETELRGRLMDDPVLMHLLGKEAIDHLLNINGYVGSAPERARKMARSVSHHLDREGGAA